MALVNYRGWRLVASSVLPIDATTIVYGSPDSCQTVYADDPALNQIMKEAASYLNIKVEDNFRCFLVLASMLILFLRQGHEISSRENGKRVFIHAPGDVEGHRGKDGRYYLLDTHRVMPPTIALLK